MAQITDQELRADAQIDGTEEYLVEKYKEMQKKKYNFDKLNILYWKNLIFSYKEYSILY